MGYGNDKLGAYAFCDQEYPKRIAFAFLNAVLTAFQKKIGEEWKKFKEDQTLEVMEIK
jgi:synaptobrevin family protein YKT6